jgi:hypothetical protein
MTLPALAASGAVNVGANMLTDKAGKTDDGDLYSILCSIDERLAHLCALNTRQRELTPYVAELYSSFTAGVLDPGQIEFRPASNFNVQRIILTSSVPCLVVLQMSESRTAGPLIDLPCYAPLELPYHINGGERLRLGLVGNTTVLVHGFVVGYMEANRLGLPMHSDESGG